MKTVLNSTFCKLFYKKGIKCKLYRIRVYASYMSSTLWWQDLADIEKNMLRNYILIDYYEFSGLTMHAVVFLRSKISISEHKTIYKSNSIILRLST